MGRTDGAGLRGGGAGSPSRLLLRVEDEAQDKRSLGLVLRTKHI